MKLLSIDPGKSHYAWAWWGNEDRLKACGRIGGVGWSRSDAMGHLRFKDRIERCVIELPQVYQQRRWKGDPNDLIQVALTVGALEAQIHCPDILLVKPHQWKGSVPKDIMGKRIMGKLTEDERRVAEAGMAGLGAKKHDVVDAIGIGLWGLSRL